MDDKQQNFYKRLLINIRVNCLKQGIKKSEFCLKQGRKISYICLKQGQGMRGRAAPPHPGIYRVPPPPRTSMAGLKMHSGANRNEAHVTGPKYGAFALITQSSRATWDLVNIFQLLWDQVARMCRERRLWPC